MVLAIIIGSVIRKYFICIIFVKRIFLKSTAAAKQFCKLITFGCLKVTDMVGKKIILYIFSACYRFIRKILLPQGKLPRSNGQSKTTLPVVGGVQ